MGRFTAFVIGIVAGMFPADGLCDCTPMTREQSEVEVLGRGVSRSRLWHLAALVAIAAVILAPIRHVRSEWVVPILLSGLFAFGLLFAGLLVLVKCVWPEMQWLRSGIRARRSGHRRLVAIAIDMIYWGVFGGFVLIYLMTLIVAVISLAAAPFGAMNRSK